VSVISPIDNRILQVLVPVRQLERARAWYCALLDVEEPPIDGDHTSLEMQGVGLTLWADPGMSRLDRPTFVLRVEDLAAAAAFLRQHGIAARAEDGRSLTFQDPDGNVLMACGPD
jgi:catechol 2,3-dioxygenase-like lactoylglutathione lyase family enzyme